MAICTKCGLSTISVEKDVICECVVVYYLNKPGSPRREDILSQAKWHIVLCESCMINTLQRTLESTRKSALFFGPFILVLSTILGGMVLLGNKGLGTHKILAGFGLYVLIASGIGLIMGLLFTIIGPYISLKANNKLMQLKGGKEYEFDTDDKNNILIGEAERVYKELKNRRSGFYGDFKLPQLHDIKKYGDKLEWRVVIDRSVSLLDVTQWTS